MASSPLPDSVMTWALDKSWGFMSTSCFTCGFVGLCNANVIGELVADQTRNLCRCCAWLGYFGQLIYFSATLEACLWHFTPWLWHWLLAKCNRPRNSKLKMLDCIIFVNLCGHDSALQSFGWSWSSIRGAPLFTSTYFVFLILSCKAECYGFHYTSLIVRHILAPLLLMKLLAVLITVIVYVSAQQPFKCATIARTTCLVTRSRYLII